MLEADGIPKHIPAIIRSKLEDSYLSKEDAKRLLAQQELTIKMLHDVMKSLVLPKTVAAAQVEGIDANKKASFRSNLEDQIAKTSERIIRFKREVGLD
jgi:hypothetical protein